MKRAAGAWIAAALALPLCAAPARAQSAGWPANDAFQLRFGYFFPEGGGDLWDGNEEVFTIDASDFEDFTFGIGWVHSFGNQFEVGVNLDFYDETQRSHYRDYVDEDGFLIFHDTELSHSPLSVDFRFLPGGRYRTRSGGRLVLKPVFYVGGGIGAVFWDYDEYGDFIDFGGDPLVIFPGAFGDSGTAFEYHGLAGVELPLGRSTHLLFEGRYTKADDELGGDFAGFGTIELGGASIHGGFSFRF
jgi:hypothetical protein